MGRVLEILQILFNPSFWRDFIALDMREESRMLRE